MSAPERRSLCMSALALALLAMSWPVAAQQGCTPQGMSGQCNALGSIQMDFQRDIQGQPIDQTVRVLLDDNYRDTARSFLFSVRNVTEGGGSPISVALVRFTTATGDVVTTKREQPSPNHLDLWVDVLDVPVGDPIDLTVTVGARERGAYRIEALVMPFDHRYSPLKDAHGTDLSLFAFTLLGVNQPSADVKGGTGGLLGGSVAKSLPAPDAALVAAVACLAALATARRLYRRP